MSLQTTSDLDREAYSAPTYEAFAFDACELMTLSKIEVDFENNDEP